MGETITAPPYGMAFGYSLSFRQQAHTGPLAGLHEADETANKCG